MHTQTQQRLGRQLARLQRSRKQIRVPDQNQLQYRVFRQRQKSSVHGHVQAVIAAHSVDRKNDERRGGHADGAILRRSEEHTSELQSLMRFSSAVSIMNEKKRRRTPAKRKL